MRLTARAGSGPAQLPVGRTAKSGAATSNGAGCAESPSAPSPSSPAPHPSLTSGAAFPTPSSSAPPRREPGADPRKRPRHVPQAAGPGAAEPDRVLQLRLTEFGAGGTHWCPSASELCEARSGQRLAPAPMGCFPCPDIARQEHVPRCIPPTLLLARRPAVATRKEARPCVVARQPLPAVHAGPRNGAVALAVVLLLEGAHWHVEALLLGWHHLGRGSCSVQGR